MYDSDKNIIKEILQESLYRAINIEELNEIEAFVKELYDICIDRKNDFINCGDKKAITITFIEKQGFSIIEGLEKELDKRYLWFRTKNIKVLENIFCNKKGTKKYNEILLELKQKYDNVFTRL